MLQESKQTQEMATEESASTCLQKFKPLIGTAICAIGSLFFSTSNVLVKELSHVDPLMISFIRFFIIAMMSSPVTMNRIEIESPFPSGKRWLLFFRSIIGATNLIIHFYSLQVSITPIFDVKATIVY